MTFPPSVIGRDMRFQLAMILPRPEPAPRV